MKEKFIHIDTSGDKYFYLDKGMQNFHREDGPAIEYADGDKEWWVNGKRHREDGPAIEQEDVKSWYIKGDLHRENGPAVEFHDGSKAWWVDGELHREDGPAIEYSDGTKAWYINGKRHREDGPAAEYEGGYKEWWVNGKELTEEEFNDRDRVEVTFDEIAEKLGMKEQRKVAARLDDVAFDVSQFIYKLEEVQQHEFDKLWERVESKGWMEGFKDSDDARGFLWDYCFNRSIYTDKGESLQSFSEMCDAEWMPTDQKGTLIQ
ncbi:hypothetical protein N9973_00700 [bacterium]|nr:hypothetical protein [bacterium]